MYLFQSHGMDGARLGEGEKGRMEAACSVFLRRVDSQELRPSWRKDIDQFTVVYQSLPMRPGCLSLYSNTHPRNTAVHQGRGSADQEMCYIAEHGLNRCNKIQQLPTQASAGLSWNRFCHQNTSVAPLPSSHSISSSLDMDTINDIIRTLFLATRCSSCSSLSSILFC